MYYPFLCISLQFRWFCSVVWGCGDCFLIIMIKYLFLIGFLRFDFFLINNEVSLFFHQIASLKLWVLFYGCCFGNCLLLFQRYCWSVLNLLQRRYLPQTRSWTSIKSMNYLTPPGNQICLLYSDPLDFFTL